MTEGRERLKRLRWQCRRGTQELDQLLGTFLKANEDALGGGAFPEFEQLLRTEDDQLWDWLLLRTSPDDDAMKALLSSIRDSNQL